MDETLLNEIWDWITANWFELTSLLFQAAILAALIWYGREAVRISRAFQEGVESLDRPGLTLGASAYREPARTLHLGRWAASAWHGLVGWLRAPVGS